MEDEQARATALALWAEIKARTKSDASPNQHHPPRPLVADATAGAVVEQAGLPAIHEVPKDGISRDDLTEPATWNSEVRRPVGGKLELPRLIKRQLRGKAVDLETIIDSLPEGIVVLGSSGIIRRCNAPARRLLGRQASEGLTVPLASWRYWRPCDSQGSPVPIADTPLGRALFHGETSGALYRTTGETATLAVWAAPINGEDGRRTGAVGLFRPVEAAQSLQVDRKEPLLDSLDGAAMGQAEAVARAVELWQSASVEQHLSLRRELPPPGAQLDARYLERVESQLRDRATDLENILDSVPGGLIVLGPSGVIRRYNAAVESILGRQVDEGLLVPLASWRFWRPVDLTGEAFAIQDTPLGRALFEGVESSAAYRMENERGEPIAVEVSAAPIRGKSGKRTGAVATFHPLAGIPALPSNLQAPKKPDPIAPFGASATDLVDVVVKVAELWQSTTQEHRIRVRSQLPKPAGRWDRRDIERVVGNVIKRAIDHNPEGGDIDVTVRQRGDTAEVVVKDYGDDVFLLAQIGLPDRQQAEGNPRVDDRLDPELAQCREIVVNNGGKLWREQSFKDGTTIIFTLPAVTAPAIN